MKTTFKEFCTLLELRAPTQFTGLEVLQDIIGHDAICVDKDKIKDGQYYLKNVDPNSKWDGPGFSPPRQYTYKQYGNTAAEDKDVTVDVEGTITLYDYKSRDAKDIAVAAHEAYHALMWKKGKSYFNNEKLTNNLATKWLKKNLKGPELHVALEMILQSNISYGTN